MGTPPERKVRWALLAGALAAVTGCGTSLACSAVGCASRFTASSPATVHSQAVKRMKICLDGSCQTVDVSRSRGTALAEQSVTTTAALKAQRDIIVSVTLESAGAANLMIVSKPVHFRRVAPNGIACGPVCYLADVVVHPGGIFTVTAG